MKTILFNSNNVLVGSNNSKYQYFFPQGGATFKNAKVCLSSLSIYYSWFNIRASYNNNTFGYYWINGTLVNITLEDGFYTVGDLNEKLQSIMISNGHYLIDDNGDYVYYLEMQENPVRYAIQVNCYATPAALPAGWSYPVNSPVAVNGLGPRLVVNNNAFQNIIGFTQGIYPAVAQNTNQSFLSSFTPQVGPISSVLLLCSIINNNLGNNNLLYSFSPNVAFGSQINIEPPNHIWMDVLDGNYTNIRVDFVDQNFNSIPINDNNLVMTLTIIDEDDNIKIK